MQKQAVKPTTEPYGEMARQAFPGPEYRQWLVWFHEWLRPRYYCEIGVANGGTLKLVKPDTFVLGVDPAYVIENPLTGWTRLFRMRSDDFFHSGAAAQALRGEKLDLSFIDGLHTFDQALRDFIGVEFYSKPGAVALFHDVLPVCEEVAARERKTGFWAGDTFKVLLALAQTRPDLRLALIPCFPSGLAIVTNLNLATPRRSPDYAAVTNALAQEDFASAFRRLRQTVRILPNDFAAIADYMGIVPNLREVSVPFFGQPPAG
jgi:hypothetical protein